MNVTPLRPLWSIIAQTRAETHGIDVGTLAALVAPVFERDRPSVAIVNAPAVAALLEACGQPVRAYEAGASGGMDGARPFSWGAGTLPRASHGADVVIADAVGMPAAGAWLGATMNHLALVAKRPAYAILCRADAVAEYQRVVRGSRMTITHVADLPDGATVVVLRSGMERSGLFRWMRSGWSGSGGSGT